MFIVTIFDQFLYILSVKNFFSGDKKFASNKKKDLPKKKMNF